MKAIHDFQYDLIVIGGGSGGLSCSRTASLLGAKVALLDYVTPSPLGTTWGLGGTCVNVGCIPKKLMHHAGNLGQFIKDSQKFGWKVPDKVDFNWEQLVNNVQSVVKGTNWNYRVALRSEKVTYINALGEFVNRNTVKCTDKNGKISEITAKYVLIAVGGRPIYPDFPGAKEYCITSDDIFSLDRPPGKSLIIGASYISLETGGFLNELKFDTTIMVRSILLRGFDQQMANRVGGYMESHGVKFLYESIPHKVEESGKNINGLPEYTVTWKNIKNGKFSSEIFNTVLLATGRRPDTDRLCLSKAEVSYLSQTGKIQTKNYQTNIEGIFAIGDIVEGTLELTPVAINAGNALAHKLFPTKQKRPADFSFVATTIFTPLEYGCVGLSEEDAIKKLGEENIEVYHFAYNTVEWGASQRLTIENVSEINPCYAKIICDKNDDERVIGLHMCGPNAGEIVQGFVVAMRLGATKDDFNMTVGIHPTQAEELVQLTVSKSSGRSFEKKTCCG